MKSRCLLTAVSVSASLFIPVKPTFGQNWALTSAPFTNWTSLASSADGTRLVAGVSGGGIYRSTDAGSTWALTTAPTNSWASISCSADGIKLLASGSGGLYTSTDSGTTWAAITNLDAPVLLNSVVSSADGSKLVAVGPGPSFYPEGAIVFSTNAGAVWSEANGELGSLWTSVAASAGGDKLVAGGYIGVDPGPLITSSNSGASWTHTATLGYWISVASSAEGNKLVAGTASIYGAPPRMYTSADSGATWIRSSAPTNQGSWQSVALSADGTSLAAAVYGGPIFTSRDSGGTWVSNSAPVTNWSSVSSSADGGKLVAAVNGGGIWVWQTIPTPSLSLALSGTNLLLSWIVPSESFTLQQNSDLTMSNWVDVTNVPVLNLANLRNEVLVPAPSSSRFFRLKH